MVKFNENFDLFYGLLIKDLKEILLTVKTAYCVDQYVRKVENEFNNRTTGGIYEDLLAVSLRRTSTLSIIQEFFSPENKESGRIKIEQIMDLVIDDLKFYVYSGFVNLYDFEYMLAKKIKPRKNFRKIRDILFNGIGAYVK